VLQQPVGHHHVAHLHALAQATGHAEEEHAVDLVVVDQQRRRDGRCHLADARQHRDHRLPGELAEPELPPAYAPSRHTLDGREQGGQFLVHRGDQGGS
jgi:hypothetical protein